MFEKLKEMWHRSRKPEVDSMQEEKIRISAQLDELILQAYADEEVEVRIITDRVANVLKGVIMCCNDTAHAKTVFTMDTGLELLMYQTVGDHTRELGGFARFHVKAPDGVTIVVRPTGMRTTGDLYLQLRLSYPRKKEAPVVSSNVENHGCCDHSCC